MCGDGVAVSSVYVMLLIIVCAIFSYELCVDVQITEYFITVPSSYNFYHVTFNTSQHEAPWPEVCVLIYCQVRGHRKCQLL